jgi:hypothetical protein
MVVTVSLFLGLLMVLQLLNCRPEHVLKNLIHTLLFHFNFEDKKL